MSDFAQQLAEVRTSVEQLRTLMSEGQPADMADLAPRLEALNAALPGLPKEEGAKHLDALNALDQALAELRQDMVRQREGAEAALREIATRLKASTAYAKSAAAIDRSDESA